MIIRNVLITGGPVWAPIDRVRVISNIATGEIASILEKEAKNRAIRPTTILGPVYFDDFFRSVKQRVSSKKYDAIIHAAAVSDYQLVRPFKGKVSSGKEKLVLRLVAAPKIVRKIKKWDNGIFLVMFKLEFGASDEVLIQRARSALIKAGADLVVANRIRPSYKAFILDARRIYCSANSKRQLAKKIFDTIEGF